MRWTGTAAGRGGRARQRAGRWSARVAADQLWMCPVAPRPAEAGPLPEDRRTDRGHRNTDARYIHGHLRLDRLV